MKWFISGIAVVGLCFNVSASEIENSDTLNIESSPSLFGLGGFWGANSSSYEQGVRAGLEASVSSIPNDEVPFFIKKSFLLAADYRNGISAGISYSGFWEPIRYTSGSFEIATNIGAGVYIGSTPDCWFNDEDENQPTNEAMYEEDSGDSCTLNKLAFGAYPELGARISYGAIHLSPFVRYYIGDSGFLTSGVNVSLAF
ncbi:hypothetical protein Q8W40_17885 [Vibrio penaeicida]|uniref:hypothetical protein n=1 Tax=Vibrio penaeicida TaxID=104609 RepID=UPI00273473FD|nr:hypothetical protein [Vibrio penaeicida]MDP2574071.1 hypothetical protein [Vibrio penaeicida]